MFRKEFVTSIEIDAPAQRVWDVLAGLSAYPRWNPMIRRASGEMRVGARLTVRFEPDGSRGHTFRPRLLVVEPGRELRWLGWPRFPWVFDSEHYWIMEEMPGGMTRLQHGAVVYGLAAPLAGKAMAKTSRGPFEKMNHAHKEQSEMQSAVPT
jgi:hypothetical protein